MANFLLSHAVTTWAERTPDREAVRFSGKSLTYAELESQTNQLARVLRDQGVRRGDRVGIYMNKGLESAVSIYGIMKSGGAYVPLDPFAPANRIQYVIEDCGIRHLITNELKGDQRLRQRRPRHVRRSRHVRGLVRHPGPASVVEPQLARSQCRHEADSSPRICSSAFRR